MSELATVLVERRGELQVVWLAGEVDISNAGALEEDISDAVPNDAAALIHQVSRGLPRAINNLAIQSLVAAYAAKKAIVDESSARAAVTEITAE